MEENNYIWLIPFFLILLGMEHIISKTVAALDNLSEADIKEEMEENKKMQIAARMMGELQEKSNLLLGILTSINVIMGVIYGSMFYPVSRDILRHLNYHGNNLVLEIIFEVLFITILAYIIILFGNILPRKLGLKNSKQIVNRNILFLNSFFRIWKPFGIVIHKSIYFLLRCMGISPEELEDNLTEDEIISVVNEGLEQGVLEDSEVEMISNIIEFDEKEVRDIMTHRKKIVALDSAMTVKEALQFILETTYSRFPVYEENIDNIVGVLYLKDIMKYYVINEEKEDMDIQIVKLVKPPYLVPDTQGIDVLFHDMQLKNIHMAVAIDEYGQTAGIVAMEDILEEIVGNISDEFDIEEKTIIPHREGRYFIKGSAPLDEVEKALEIDMEDEKEDYDTLNGLLVSLLGHIPESKERATVEYKGYLFHILDVQNNMIHYVRVMKKERDFQEKQQI